MQSHIFTTHPSRFSTPLPHFPPTESSKPPVGRVVAYTVNPEPPLAGVHCASGPDANDRMTYASADPGPTGGFPPAGTVTEKQVMSDSNNAPIQ